MTETVAGLPALFAARSVAIVGDSGSGRGQGAVLRRRLTECGYAGAIHPVNPKYSSIGGLVSYPSVSAIPGGVDLVACALPAGMVLDVLAEAEQAGASAFIVLAAGFAEVGAGGQSLQAEVTQAANKSGICLIGPNSLGAADLWGSGQFYFGELAGGLQRGHVGIVFQSGALVETITEAFVHAGVGVSHIVTTGNEAVVDTAACIDALAADPNVRVIACLLETIRDAARFRRAALHARAAGKAVLTLCNGLSEAGRRMAVSHTGALVGSRRTYSAVLRSAGVVPVDDIEELVEAVTLLSTPTGRRLFEGTATSAAVVSHSGGVCALLCDLAADAGLALASLSEPGRAALRELLPAYCTIENPLDMTAVGGLDMQLRDRVLDVLAAEPEVGVVLYGLPSTDVDGASNPDVYPRPLLQSAVRAAASPMPTVFAALTSRQVAGSLARDTLRYGAPLLSGARAAVHALKAVMAANVDEGVPALAGGEASASGLEAVVDDISALTDVAGERAAKALLARLGIPAVPDALAGTADEAVGLAEALGGPVALKAESAGLIHKSDVGGVQLGVVGADAVRAAFREISAAATAASGAAAVAGVLVQPMVVDGVDVIVGVSWDEHLGAMVACGIGGVLAEAIDDVAVRCAPVTEVEALGMIHELRLARLLTEGFRQTPAGDVDALARVVSTVSVLADRLGAAIDSIDINPIRVLPRGHGVVVLDAAIVPGASVQGEGMIR